MKIKKLLFAGVFVLAVCSAFTTKTLLYENFGSYRTPTNDCSIGPLVQGEEPYFCSTGYTGPQCTVWGYGWSGVQEFPAYRYDRPTPYCALPLYQLF